MRRKKVYKELEREGRKRKEGDKRRGKVNVKKE